jgi:hypothetical protein
MSEGSRIKGFALRGLLRYVKESGYPGGIPALLEHLPDESAGFFAERILSGSWYPYEAFSALVGVIVEQLGGETRRDALLDGIGRSSAQRDLQGVFRFVSVILSVERIVRASASFWPRYCDTGSLEVVDAGNGHFTVRLVGFHGIDPAHCQLIRGWMFGLGEGSGARSIAVDKTSCVHRGDDYCEYTGSWS